VEKGDIFWADLGVPLASEPGFRRPVLVVQSDQFNRSRLPTVLVAPFTRNLRLARAPGNVRLDAAETGLPQPSVVNVSGIVSIDRDRLHDFVSRIDAAAQFLVDAGIRLVFDV